MRRLICSLTFLMSGAILAADTPACHKPAEIETGTVKTAAALPDVTLIDQDGQARRFPDIVDDRIVIANFIFTTCGTICPPMGANFAEIEALLGDRFADEVALISISIDPVTDTPDHLKAWREKLGGQDGWSLYTGKKQDVDLVLKHLEVFTADKTRHGPLMMIGNGHTGSWERLNGFTAPKVILERVTALVEANPAPESKSALVEPSPAERYFTNTTLIDQHGRELAFYKDLIEGKTVLIHSFFSTCKSVCPSIMKTVDAVQKAYGDREDVQIISISVDPLIDSPEILKTYADANQIGPRWSLVSGKKANVERVLQKIGQYVEVKEAHSNVFIMGNARTGLWKKAFGLAGPEEVVRIFGTVVEDAGQL